MIVTFISESKNKNTIIQKQILTVRHAKVTKS